MSKARLPYGRQLIDDDDVREVTACLTSPFLTQGPRVAAFEAAVAEVTGARFAVAVANGTVALHVAALALGVRPGDVGLVPAVTFLASAHCVKFAGGEVRFTDVEPDTGLVSVASLESIVAELDGEGKKPRVIVPVDLTGQPSDWAKVRRIADLAGARMLLDAAHSLGSTSDVAGVARRLGESGADAAILSFHPVKHVTTAEGGAIVTNDEGLYREMAELRTFGLHKDPARFSRSTSDPFVGPWYHETSVLGFNYRLSDVHSALGLSQMKKLPAFLARRREIAARYDAALGAAPLAGHLAPVRQHAGRTSAYHLYVARVLGGADVTETAVLRKDLFAFLASKDILCQVHYVPLPWQPYYRALELDPAREYPGAAAYYASCISLPMFPAMADGDVDRVTDALGEWVSGRG